MPEKLSDYITYSNRSKITLTQDEIRDAFGGLIAPSIASTETLAYTLVRVVHRGIADRFRQAAKKVEKRIEKRYAKSQKRRTDEAYKALLDEWETATRFFQLAAMEQKILQKGFHELGLFEALRREPDLSFCQIANPTKGCWEEFRIFFGLDAAIDARRRGIKLSTFEGIFLKIRQDHSSAFDEERERFIYTTEELEAARLSGLHLYGGYAGSTGKEPSNG